jgi:hypothetical protein
MLLVNACKTITTCAAARPRWAAHQRISGMGLISGRLVKKRRSALVAASFYPEPVRDYAGGILCKLMRIVRRDCMLA